METVDQNPSYPSPDPSGSGSAIIRNPMAYLAQLVTEEDERFDLGHAALAIAAAHYVRFDLKTYLTTLDRLADEAERRIRRVRRPDRILSRLNGFLFDELGFRGNREAYYDPSNSFLNEVLDRRLGLPITLSVLYLAIGRRIGLPLVGVALPLHFIIKYPLSDGDIFVDPFNGGAFLSPADCQAKVERIVGGPVVFDPAYLNGVPNRLILYRLLNNLKHIYIRRDQPERAGRVVEQMLVVSPDSDEDMRDRGLLYLRENALSQGAAWLQRYLERRPDAPDAEFVRRAVERAYERRGRMN